MWGYSPSQAGGTPTRLRGEFLAWEPHSHMAFRFNHASTRSIAAFAEDYRVVPTAAGRNLTWVLGGPVMARMFPRFLHNLRAFADKRYATTA